MADHIDCHYLRPNTRRLAGPLGLDAASRPLTRTQHPPFVVPVRIQEDSPARHSEGAKPSGSRSPGLLAQGRGHAPVRGGRCGQGECPHQCCGQRHHGLAGPGARRCVLCLLCPSAAPAAPHTPRPRLCAPVCDGAAAWAACGRRGSWRVWLGVAARGPCRALALARTPLNTHFSHTRAHT
jgi:hypothetical protein